VTINTAGLINQRELPKSTVIPFHEHILASRDTCEEISILKFARQAGIGMLQNWQVLGDSGTDRGAHQSWLEEKGIAV